MLIARPVTLLVLLLLPAQVLFQQRQAALAQFQQRAQVLQQAAVVLEEGIQASRAQVGYSM